MRFKISGILLLAAGAYLAISASASVQQQRSDTLTAQVQPLVAIFLVLLVRVLQAEKHHRDWLKQASEMNEKRPVEDGISIPPLDEIATPPLEHQILETDPLLETK